MAQILSAFIEAENKQLALVNVVDGSGDIRVCDFGAVKRRGDTTSIGKAFCVSSMPLISIIEQGIKYPEADKMIYQLNGFEYVPSQIARKISSSIESGFKSSEQTIKAIEPVLSLLNDGLYAVYFTKMFPTNGAGNFFWTAYTSMSEVKGTADVNLVIGKNKPYTPCFLVPTKSASEYRPFKLDTHKSLLKSGGMCVGIAYHLSGMFCALLEGHHAATACLLEEKDFYCVVIEPVHNFYYEDKEEARDEGRIPLIKGFSTCSARVPFSSIDSSIVEYSLLSRNGKKPDDYYAIRKAYFESEGKFAPSQLPEEIHDKAENSPDYNMLASAQTITELTPGQLEALLLGEIEYEGNIIISNNYYNSVVTACNYLQYTDTDAFVDFALNIMMNSDLAATHEYLSERLLRISDKRIFDLFTQIYDNKLSQISEVLDNAQKYIDRYEEDADNNQDFNSNNNFDMF